MALGTRQRRLLAWVLWYLVDPVLHFVVLDRNWPEELPGVQKLYDLAYDGCCRICAFDLEVNPDHWTDRRPILTPSDFLFVYEEIYEDRVELRVEAAIAFARRLSTEGPDARKG